MGSYTQLIDSVSTSPSLSVEQAQELVLKITKDNNHVLVLNGVNPVYQDSYGNYVSQRRTYLVSKEDNPNTDQDLDISSEVIEFSHHEIDNSGNRITLFYEALAAATEVNFANDKNYLR